MQKLRTATSWEREMQMRYRLLRRLGYVSLEDPKKIGSPAATDLSKGGVR